MTVHKLTAGDGYTYLTRHVAGGDVDRARGQSAADYYTAEGNPPGRWIGRGAPRLGLGGQLVSESQMRALFGLGMHPDAERIVATYQAVNLRAGMSDAQIERVQDDARRAATLGRPFPVYARLEPFENRVRDRLAALTAETGRAPTRTEIAGIQREEARRQRAAVAGYDLVFAPVKSAALLWALDDRAWVRDAVRAAHEDARDSALALLEEHAALTRVGAGSVAQIDTQGLIGAAFDHYDSREGDPNLHTHVAVANKVQGVDGKWRSLDARALYRMTVATSEHYNTAFQASLSARLGVTWQPRAAPGGKEPVHEVAGVPDAFLAHFSRRRAAIESRYAELLTQYRAEHGREASTAVAHKLARQANLDTLQGKKPARSLAAMRAAWRAQLTAAFGAEALDKLGATVRDPRSGPATTVADARPADVGELAARVVAAVAEQRATWTMWNLRAEAERLLRAEGLAIDPATHLQLATAVVERATSPALSILVEAPSGTGEPAELRRADGESVFAEHAAARYTSTAVLDAEERLLVAARTSTPHALPPRLVAAALTDFETAQGRTLDDGQRQLVNAFASDPRQLVVGIGAAGTGKTTAMRAYHHVLQAAGRRLIPLATSAASAAVLATELGTPAENVHKFLHEHLHGPHAAALASGKPVPEPHQLFAVGPGDVILVDEAGMAGTFNLDRLATLAAQRGALLRPLGDYRQLAAVESGGVLRLIAADVGAAELSTLHRFTDPNEAAATLRLRIGDTRALDFYEQHHRIEGGSRDAMTDEAYTAWWADTRAGRITLMVATTNADVTALSARARTDRVAAGHVEPDGAELLDGNRAGVGDWIVTRHNDRRLPCRGGRDFVRNGDAWTVTARHADGALTVRHLEHRGTLRLPAAYVAQHVQLLYATTVHRAQGSTVDTAHVLVTDAMAREHLYVAATRARHGTRLYVATHELLPVDEDDRLDRPATDPDARAAREVLHTILGQENAELSATETIRRNQDTAESLATLMPRLVYATRLAAESRYRHVLTHLLGQRPAAPLIDGPGSDQLLAAVHEAEGGGWQPAQALAAALRQGPVTDAESPARLLAWRVTELVHDRAPGPSLARPTAEQAERYAHLVAEITGQSAAVDDSLETPSRLRTEPAAPFVPGELLARVCGSDGAEQLRTEAAWPALRSALHRAYRAGVDTEALVRSGIDRAHNSPGHRHAQLLAEFVHAHLAGASAVADPDVWPTLAWTLAAAEKAGGDAAQLLGAVEPGATIDQLRDHVAHRVERFANAGDQRVPPWTPVLPAAPEPMRGYLADLLDQIVDRSNALADEAMRTRPAWTAALGAPPAVSPQREEWRDALATVAAYRDQHQVSDDDSAHPLGSYVSVDQPGHGAYWQAAAAIVAARRVAAAGLRLRPRSAATPDEMDATHRMAVDTYRALSEAQRNGVATQLVARLGDLWHGHDSDLDSGVTQPMYARQLHEALVGAGQLDRVPPRSTRVSSREFKPEGARRRPARHAAAHTREAQRGSVPAESRPRRSTTPLIEPPRHQNRPDPSPRPRI